MDHATAILFDVVRREQALVEMPARQERRRVAQLAAEIARCCRLSIVDQLLAWLDRPAIVAAGGAR
jgi:hypothetical protein